MTDQRPTSSLLQQFESLLRNRLTGNSRNVRLRFRDDGIVLQGHVSSYYAKQLAQHAAIEVTGLRVLANDIEVRPGVTSDG